DHDYGGVIANQLDTLAHIGLFAQPLPRDPQLLPYLVDFNDTKADLDLRARSYLHSNCAHCHMKWGGGNAEFKLLATLPVAEMGIAGVKANHGDFGIKGAKLLVPGHPEQSLIAHRMAMTGLGRMPHIGSKEVDDKAVALIRDWIRGMKAP